MAKGKSFQNEVPESRVNIRYVKHTGGAQEAVELPLKLLLIGDYSGRPDQTPLEERKRISIDQNNFDAVLREQGLHLTLVVPNRLKGEEGEELQVDLAVDSLKSFTPDEIVNNVPELKKMLLVRSLLTDLKARVITNRKFRLQLEQVLKDERQLKNVMAELDRLAPVSEETEEAVGPR